MFLRCPNVDLDAIILEKPLRELITESYPHLAEKKYDDPIDYLKSRDIEGFIWYISFTRQLEFNKENNVEYTYLQYACDVGLPEVVEALLEFGADPNNKTQENDNYPVFIASFKGYVEIIRIFLESEKYIIFHSTKGSVVHEVLRGWTENSNKSHVKNELCNYEMSFNMLLGQCKYNLYKTPKIDINWVDDDGNTCLNFAVKSNKKNIIFALLDHNAYIGKLNKCRNPLLAEISYEILESYLDSCVTSKLKSPNVINYEINMSYKFLCPPIAFSHRNIINDRVHFESQKETVILEKIKETDPLLYMSEVPALRPLLVHPVISSFIFFKWHKIKLFYYINFLLYLLFVFNLNMFILFHDKNILLKTYGFGWFGVLFGNLGVCFRELFQMITSPIKYIMNFQNWIEILMVILIYCLLFNILNEGFRIQVSAIVFLISWGQILFFIGRHPVQAINLEIFKVVTVNFLKFLTWFAILIVAFILCFYMLFRYNEHSNVWDMLEKISLMSFETILMLSGEFNIKDEEFNLYPYSIISRVLFILFIFLINIVLINLLSGLAVSDIQEIKNVSKVIAMTSNVRFVHEFETLLHERNFISYIFSLCVRFKLCAKLELFPDALKNPNLTIKSNQNFQDKIANAVLDGIYLDNEGIIKATSICNSNLEKSKEKCTNIYEKFNSIEQSMNILKEMLKDMD